jgi:hypothetical protein
MKSFLYLMAVLMFGGLALMVWSSYKAVAVLQDSELPSPPVPAGQAPVRISNPEIPRYVSFSYVGLGMFLIGAVGGIIAAVRVMVHRY